MIVKSCTCNKYTRRSPIIFHSGLLCRPHQTAADLWGLVKTRCTPLPVSCSCFFIAFEIVAVCFIPPTIGCSFNMVNWSLVVYSAVFGQQFGLFLRQLLQCGLCTRLEYMNFGPILSAFITSATQTYIFKNPSHHRPSIRFSGLTSRNFRWHQFFWAYPFLVSVFSHHFLFYCFLR